MGATIQVQSNRRPLVGKHFAMLHDAGWKIHVNVSSNTGRRIVLAAQSLGQGVRLGQKKMTLIRVMRISFPDLSGPWHFPDHYLMETTDTQVVTFTILPFNHAPAYASWYRTPPFIVKL